jgi:hypothetical protein
VRCHRFRGGPLGESCAPCQSGSSILAEHNPQWQPDLRFSNEQFTVELVLIRGVEAPLAYKEAGIVEQTFYWWRREYGGLQLERARKGSD